jgi:hypothetical protein
MERKRITCPETAHLEEVDIEQTPLGVLIEGCSRFQPRCNVQCARCCAALMDVRDKRDDSLDIDFSDDDTGAVDVDALPLLKLLPVP